MGSQKKGIKTANTNVQLDKIKQYIKIIPKPSTVVDAGAFVGAWSIALCKLFKANRPTIYAVEPVVRPQLVAALKPWKNIILVEHGFSNRTQPEYFLPNYGGSMMLMRDIDNKHKPNSEVISCFTWNDFVNKYKIERVDLLKCDVETSEKKLFEGMRKVFPMYIEIEFHHGCHTDKSAEEHLPKLAKNYELIKRLGRHNTYLYKFKKP